MDHDVKDQKRVFYVGKKPCPDGTEWIGEIIKRKDRGWDWHVQRRGTGSTPIAENRGTGERSRKAAEVRVKRILRRAKC